MGRKKLQIDFIRSEFEKEGYKLLTEEYKSCSQKLDYICPKGHEHNISWDNWKQGKRCPYCAGVVKLTIEDVRSEFEKNGYTLLSKNYVNAHQKLECICPNGHKYITTWDSWRDGHRCSYCAGNAKHTIEFIRHEFEKENYTLLSDNYINNEQKLKFICPNGHTHHITWASWIRGSRCIYCSYKKLSLNNRLNTRFIADKFQERGYTLLTNNYTNAHQVLECVCDNGHHYSVSYNNWYSKKYRCPVCNETGRSKAEAELAEFIVSMGLDIKENDRDLISPREIDIVIPDKKVAIEYCGLYWHSEINGKHKYYHLDKLNSCEAKKYRLITIFEDEFLHHKDVLFSRLKYILGVGSPDIIYARNCKIERLSVKDAKCFCENNHMQGYAASNIKLGLVYNGKLVSVMTFSKPSIAKGGTRRKNIKNHYELVRFCSKMNYKVVGGASKLLKYFERNYNWSCIYSYADRRWSNGDLYDKLGFTLKNILKPNYWYIDTNKQKRIHRFVLRKTKNDPKDQTEWQIRQSQGWNRIWDCGNLKYTKVSGV